MYDYDAQYRRLREAGLPGWAGHQHERNLSKLAQTLDRLERDGILPSPPARLLELGCGTGMSSFLMAQKGYKISGIDIAATAVDWARERFAAAGLTGSFHHGDVCSMPFFETASFDIVFDGACLHCLIGEDRKRCLAEVRRILRPSGVFIVSSMCGLPKSEDAKVQFDQTSRCLMKDGKPYRTLKPLANLVDEVSNAGFTVESHALSANPWWDHVTMICRIADE
jgi:ubiquinone/menaquinone biosynthesis C-methylase UbiE